MSGGKIGEQMIRRVNDSDNQHYAKAQHPDLSGTLAELVVNCGSWGHGQRFAKGFRIRVTGHRGMALLFRHWMLRERVAKCGRNFLQRLPSEIAFRRKISQVVRKLQLVAPSGKFPNRERELFGGPGAYIVRQRAQRVKLLHNRLFVFSPDGFALRPRFGRL